MDKKNFIKIIKEEISDFDFLGNDVYQKEKEIVDLLKKEEFQKQFICDSLLKKNKLKIEISDSTVGGDWDEDPENASKLTLTYFLKIEYKYDQTKEPIKFELNFNSDYISIRKNSDFNAGNYGLYIPPEGGDWISELNWNDINVTLNTVNGDEIEFIAFERAPDKIKTLFIREFTSDYIEKYINLDIRTPETNMQAQNTPYCLP
jgi:hypothetical protein